MSSCGILCHPVASLSFLVISWVILWHPIRHPVPTTSLKHGPFQKLEFQRITAQQTQVQLMLSWGSVHMANIYCSNIEQVGLIWAPLCPYYFFLRNGQQSEGERTVNLGLVVVSVKKNPYWTYINAPEKKNIWLWEVNFSQNISAFHCWQNMNWIFICLFKI
jgi:hypothetical protein